MSCPCGELEHRPLVPLFEARQRLIDAATPINATERVALAQALGRVLAQAVTAPVDLPGVDNSAMDGFALRLADYAATGEGLPVLLRVPAGAGVLHLQEGGCARIFTGAPVPLGADTVVAQERTRLDERGCLHLDEKPTLGANIRRQGEETRSGATLLEAGDTLDAPAIALLASHGVNTVSVYRRLTVALLSTGDELIEPWAARAPGQVFDSNRAMLSALLVKAQCEVIDLGIVADEPEALYRALQTATTSADVVLCSGGASVGEEDHVRSVIERLGRIDFHGVAVKPGKPFAFATLGSGDEATPLIALPGNPVASLVGWHWLALAFIHARQGRCAAPLQRYRVKAGFHQRGPRGRCELLRVTLTWHDDTPVARLAGGQGSHMLSAASQADGYLMVEPDTDVTAGHDYLFYPLSPFDR
ncbi:molybdopterin molybdotransferase MoeA [Vreelandella sp. EE22]